MTPNVRAVLPDATLEEARIRLDEWRISCLAVVEEVDDQYQLQGVVTLTDLVRAGTLRSRPDRSAELLLPNAPVTSIMTPDVIRVSGTDTLATAARTMVERDVHRVFVEDRQAVQGVLSTRDVMRVLARDGVSAPIGNYMTTPVRAVHAKTTISAAMRIMEEERISGIVVLERGWPCGVFTHREILCSRHMPHDTLVGSVTNPAILVLPEGTPVHRAAANAASVEVRRVIVSRQKAMVGIMSGLDFCRIAALQTSVG